MKITDAYIDTGTLTGRSGINLDEFGYINKDSNIIFWVLDGVSPIIFRRKDFFQFKKFFRAGKILNNLFKSESWNNIHCSFQAIFKKIKEGLESHFFFSGSFFHWPLFSCALVKIEKKNAKIELALYGDCVIIIRKGELLEVYDHSQLETKKISLNKTFRLFDSVFHSKVSECFKKVIFAIIRVKQIWFGSLRVFSFQKYFSPAFNKIIKTENIDEIAIISDGVSWFIKNNNDNLKELMNSLSTNGVSKSLSWLRSLESSNIDFGNNDDATAVFVKLWYS